MKIIDHKFTIVWPLTVTVIRVGARQFSKTSFVETNELVEACITNEYVLVKSICLFILTRWIMV